MNKKLVIKGHKSRGKEVIKLLEMLGGKHCNSNSPIVDTASDCYYRISNDGFIYGEQMLTNYKDSKVFTLEEFLEKYPFKVRDFIRIPEYESELCILKMKWCPVSEHIEYMVCPNDEEEWFTAVELLEYNDNPNKTRDCKKCGLHFGSVQCFDKDCPHNAPKSYAVSLVGDKVIDNLTHKDVDMNTCKDSECMNSDITDCKIAYLSINNEDYADQIEIDLGDNYEYKFEMNRLYIVKKKPKYPTTYTECCQHLGCDDKLSVGKLIPFQQLINARNAYWKIYGEEMGFGKPWEPDWENYNEYKYCIYITENTANTGIFYNDNRILAFPTEEMRDVFYENFKELIEDCKELL